MKACMGKGCEVREGWEGVSRSDLGVGRDGSRGSYQILSPLPALIHQHEAVWACASGFASRFF